MYHETLPSLLFTVFSNSTIIKPGSRVTYQFWRVIEEVFVHVKRSKNINKYTFILIEMIDLFNILDIYTF